MREKKNYWLGVMCMICMFMIGMLFPVKVHAEIASGTCGTCSWIIDDDGVLTISPSDRVSGTLADYPSNRPWKSDRTSVKKVVIMPGVKAGTSSCKSLFTSMPNCTEMDLHNLDTSNAKSFERMFEGCRTITTLDLSSFNTSSVQSFNYMFHYCYALQHINMTGFDTSHVSDMSQMFYECKSLKELDLSGWGGSALNNTYSMFIRCYSLKTVNLDGFQTQSVTNMQNMFYQCINLEELDLSSFNTSSVTSMQEAFYTCYPKRVKLGPNFSFVGTSKQCGLSDIGGRTYRRVDNAYSALTAEELRTTYNGSEMAGTWIVDTPPIKYAVQLYGIHEGMDKNDSLVGMTFGPAIGSDYIQSFHAHTPAGKTALGNNKRCLHNDDWATIVGWNYADPFVYEDCIQEGCTHTIELDLPSLLRNPKFDASLETGDGPGALYQELTTPDYPTDAFRRWTEQETNQGGWGTSRIRAMLNGADELTLPDEEGLDSSTSGFALGADEFGEETCIFYALPDVLKNNIARVAVHYDTVYNQKTEENLQTSYDRLWLLSADEIWADDLLHTTNSGWDSTIWDQREATETTPFSKFRGITTPFTQSNAALPAYAPSSDIVGTHNSYMYYC